MHKSFTIKKSKFKRMSNRKGSLDFYLVDEFGEKRTVFAIARLGRNKKIISVQAVYKRETPLVEALAKASINDIVEVDFTGFNKLHPRVTNGHLTPPSNGFPKTIDYQYKESASHSFAMEKPQFLTVALSFLTIVLIAMIIIF